VLVGEAAAAGLLSKPQPWLGAHRLELGRGRGNVEVGRVRGLQVGSWASPSRWPLTGWGFRAAEVREIRGRRYRQRLPQVPLLLCVQPH
jgi:hypothetical protein